MNLPIGIVFIVQEYITLNYTICAKAYGHDPYAKKPLVLCRNSLYSKIRAK